MTPTSSVVLGAGNGGLALAGDMALLGASVWIWEHPDFAEDFRPLLETHSIEVDTGLHAAPQLAHLAGATHDLAEALHGADIAHLVVPVSAQERLLREIIPRLHEDQTLVIWAGRFGGLRSLALLREYPDAARFTVAEVNTLPHGSRRLAPGRVAISFRAQVLYGAGSAPPADRALNTIAQLYPVLRRATSLLEVTFRNSGIPLLGVGALMNIGAIEARGREFSLFRDGMTPAVRRAIRLAHEEMIAVGRSLGFTIEPYPDDIYEGPTSIEGANFRDREGGTDGFFRLTGPDRLVHRYTIENIRYGLAVIAALGKRSGVETPFIDALCTICDRLCGPDFRALGWRLEDLGIDDRALT